MRMSCKSQLSSCTSGSRHTHTQWHTPARCINSEAYREAAKHSIASCYRNVLTVSKYLNLDWYHQCHPQFYTPIFVYMKWERDRPTVANRIARQKNTSDLLILVLFQPGFCPTHTHYPQIEFVFVRVVFVATSPLPLLLVLVLLSWLPFHHNHIYFVSHSFRA